MHILFQRFVTLDRALHGLSMDDLKVAGLPPVAQALFVHGFDKTDKGFVDFDKFLRQGGVSGWEKRGTGRRLEPPLPPFGGVTASTIPRCFLAGCTDFPLPKHHKRQPPIC